MLVGWQEGHPACKKTEWWGAGIVVCLERNADLHTAQLMPLPLAVSCFTKIQRLVLPFWYRLTRVVPDRGPLNRCVCVCVSGRLSLQRTIVDSWLTEELSEEKSNILIAVFTITQWNVQGCWDRNTFKPWSVTQMMLWQNSARTGLYHPQTTTYVFQNFLHYFRQLKDVKLEPFTQMLRNTLSSIVH